MTFNIFSDSFEHGKSIPIEHTSDGTDVSPPLRWSGVPANTRSLALLVEDPDAPDPAAPTRVWVHWILYNLPADSTGLAQAVADDALPSATRHGSNDWQRTGYGGPCPPIGRHRYFFRLFALDSEMPNLNQPTAAALRQAMQGHIVGETCLMGTYSRR